MEEASENSKELSHSAHANGMNEWMNERMKHTPGLCRNSSRTSGTLCCFNFLVKHNQAVQVKWACLMMSLHN